MLVLIAGSTSDTESILAYIACAGGASSIWAQVSTCILQYLIVSYLEANLFHATLSDPGEPLHMRLRNYLQWFRSMKDERLLQLRAAGPGLRHEGSDRYHSQCSFAPPSNSRLCQAYIVCSSQAARHAGRLLQDLVVELEF